MRVAIIGCGLIGHKRARALGGHHLVAVADVNPDRAAQFASQFPGCDSSANWRDVVARRDVDAVIVSTTNDALATVTGTSVEQGKHVLVEKPAARSAQELAPVANAARRAGVVANVGFSHR